MKIRPLQNLAAWWAVIAVLCGIAIAQNLTNGGVTGTVTDPSGAVVANANVTLKNRATGAIQTTHTNSTGLYAFPFVQPSDYSITVQASGFQSVSKSVTVTLNSNATAILHPPSTAEQPCTAVTR